MRGDDRRKVGMGVKVGDVVGRWEGVRDVEDSGGDVVGRRVVVGGRGGEDRKGVKNVVVVVVKWREKDVGVGWVEGVNEVRDLRDGVE